MKNKTKIKSQLDENIQNLLDKAIKEWKIIENSCKSAYFISNPKSHLDNLSNEKK